MKEQFKRIMKKNVSTDKIYFTQFLKMKKQTSFSIDKTTNIIAYFYVKYVKIYNVF